ncbi:MAG TPA: putative baseplate assembly protein [Candidatus Angelobacter sp.]|nr:putative baseplate assembly protein [Candidatus Angelobacter sp.]
MSNGSTPKLNSCGCCQGEPDLTTISNRPGLSALSYRIGTYGLFFQRMLDQIHSYSIPDGSATPPHPLALLTTRSESDPTIALLDAWAVIADVLTFYQERIANEGFLRTAIERRSILELAREIGYELSPGVAASAYLQFTVEEVIGTTPPPSVNIPGVKVQPPAGPGSSAFNSGMVDIPQGTQVQSIPAPGQVPQTFETSADFQAQVNWNTLQPRLTRQQDLALDSQGNLYLLGTSSSFPSGAVQLQISDLYLLNPLTQLDFMLKTFHPPHFIGGLVFEGTTFLSATSFRQLTINTVNPFSASGSSSIKSTLVDKASLQKESLTLPHAGEDVMVEGPGSAVKVGGAGISTQGNGSGSTVPGVPVNFIYLQGTSTGIKTGDRLLLVGMQNQDTKTAAFIVRNVETDSTSSTTLIEFADSVALPAFSPGIFPATDLKVANIPFNQDSVAAYILSKTITEGDLQAFIKMNGWNEEDLATLVNNPPPAPPSQEGVYSFGATAAFFGNNAPLWGSLPVKGNVLRGDPYPDPPGDWDAQNSGHGRTIWTDSQNNPYHGGDADAFLERSFPQILKNSWAWLECPNTAAGAYQITSIAEKSLADYGISGKTTGLSLSSSDDPNNSAQFFVRKTTARVQSQQLMLAGVPIVDEITAGTTSIMLNEMVLGLMPGQSIALSGTQSDPPGVAGSEILFLQNVTHTAGFTVLSFTTVPGFNTGLKNSYIRSSVVLNANVTLATHGATVREVLGSGNGSKTNQSFTLKRPPLTYVSAPTPSGTQSSLQVRVNGLEWEESPTLYGLTPSDQKYIVRLADDGTPTLTFGDPASRLKTGSQNVTSTYRTGIGLAGNVAAGSLSLLQSRPPGLRGVTNPLPASGAADPQNIADARSNAPLTVLTLDRIVSLEDYQSFAQAFAGIGKAQAVAIWSGAAHIVQITVAAADGSPINPTDPLSQTLIQAITMAHDPVQSFSVAGFQPLTFNLSASILIDQPTYLPSVVMAAVASALTTAFAFSQRSFAQAVTAAEILKLIQDIPGVIAVTLTQLYRTDDSNGPSQTEPLPFLPSLPARFENNAIKTAQLLLLNPLGMTLTEMTS